MLNGAQPLMPFETQPGKTVGEESAKHGNTPNYLGLSWKPSGLIYG